MSRFRDTPRRRITWADVRDGRVDISRLEEQRGWLGPERTPTPMDAPYRLYRVERSRPPVTAGDFLHGITKGKSE